MNHYDNANNYIKEKIKENNITQKELANAALGMNQSNFNTALNQKNGRHFTLEQYIAIADYLNVSLDTLFGREVSATQISARSICSWIIALLKSKRVELLPISRNYFDAQEYDNTIYPLAKNHYALLFPRFDNISERFKEFQRLHIMGGSPNAYDNTDYDNEAINNFIEKYQDIEQFYREKGMPEEAYNIVIDTYLNELNSGNYCSPQEFQKRESKSNVSEI